MPNDNVVPFPPQLRAVPSPQPYPAPENAPAIVVHDGRPYLLNKLLRGLTHEEMKTISRSAPASGQGVWDEVTRRWPALADEIAAAAGPAE